MLSVVLLRTVILVPGLGPLTDLTRHRGFAREHTCVESAASPRLTWRYRPELLRMFRY